MKLVKIVLLGQLSDGGHMHTVNEKISSLQHIVPF